MKKWNWFWSSNLLNLEEQLRIPSLFRPILRCTKLFDSRLDKLDAKRFHKLCDKYPETVIIIKSRNYISGGYFDRTWFGKKLYKSSEKSFLFNLNRMKKYHIKKNQYAGFCDRESFPCFGSYFTSLFLNLMVF